MTPMFRVYCYKGTVFKLPARNM